MKALVELGRIPSVCDEGGGGYPFGKAVDQVLRKALQIANELGFRIQYGDGDYYGIAEIGEGIEMLGVFIQLAGKTAYESLQDNRMRRQAENKET
jgi:hypothetical protein